jgi:hypothetical protein
MSHAGPHQGLGQRWYFTMKYSYMNDGEASSYKSQESGPLQRKASGLHICRGTSIITIRVRSKRPLAKPSETFLHAKPVGMLSTLN